MFAKVFLDFIPNWRRLIFYQPTCMLLLSNTRCPMWNSLSLTPSGVRRDGPGLPGPLPRDGGNVARVGRHRPQLRRPLQPVRQPDGAARQREAEGEVHDEGQQPSSSTDQQHWQTEVGVCPVVSSPCTLPLSPATDGGTRGRAGHERTQLGLRRRLHETPSQEGR